MLLLFIGRQHIVPPELLFISFGSVGPDVSQFKMIKFKTVVDVLNYFLKLFIFAVQQKVLMCLKIHENKLVERKILRSSLRYVLKVSFAFII